MNNSIGKLMYLIIYTFLAGCLFVMSILGSITGYLLLAVIIAFTMSIVGTFFMYLRVRKEIKLNSDVYSKKSKL
ncbi:hypothetical protein KQ51_01356 [Candidatus Izimaplasma bacterium HR1]|jgi:hypothetical protein|uniref:hypothetical protein n=1 Tax=Candidatus Izimoplasma sp. HR1 TaxID=1541959 RepID=UPI0004F73EB6|nr:hypothetical protein KQ51_01356 [Candidatus Izimaplasma bacterium HR1]